MSKDLPLDPQKAFLASLTTMLKRHEGFSPTMYIDNCQIPTMGYGHSLKEPITLSAGTHILEDDIAISLHLLNQYKPGWKMLPNGAQLVVANLAFHLGMPRLKVWGQLWAALEAEDYLQASIEMRESLFYTESGTRAEELTAMMRSLHNKI